MTVKRIYAGEEPRVYPTLGLSVEPGDEAEFDSADVVPDDGRWAMPKAKKTRRAKATSRRRPAHEGDPSAGADSAEAASDDKPEES